MKQSLVVTSVMSKVRLPKEKLEAYINKNNKRNKPTFSNFSLPKWENISWSSAFIPVSGDLEIVFRNKQRNELGRRVIPIETWFLVTCTKRKFGSYKLAFGVSLS
jgi:hypothetical protein